MLLAFTHRGQVFLRLREQLVCVIADNGIDIRFALTRQLPPGWEGYSGRVDAHVLTEVAFPVDDQPIVYVCGSTRFVDAAADGLLRLGYDPSWIKTERFGATG